MITHLKFMPAIVVVLVALVLGGRVAYAQDSASSERGAEAGVETGSSVDGEATPASIPLDDSQESIHARYDRFEDTLYKMAQYLQKTEPARAELVMRALSRSKEERVADRMDSIARLLSKEGGNSPRYADAIEEQDAILANLRELLTILRSEDVLDENRKEQERLKELARQVAALIDAEKVHQAETQRGEPTDRISQAQERTAKRTGDIVEKIDEHDRAADGRNDEKPQAESESEDRESEEEGREESDSRSDEDSDSKEGQDDSEQSGQGSEQGDGEQQEGEQQEGGDSSDQSDSGEQQSGQQGQKGQQGQQGQPQQGQQGQQGPSQQSGGSPQATPGREELEAARERMERAIEELKEENRKNASKEQEEAIRKLIEAKERIEELLRQLREEERELLLRALEARFQKMLQLQQVVLATTQDLNELQKDQWQDREFARCRDAAAAEREIVLEADKALEVLRADGSSVAFPEAVAEIRTDVQEVAARLGRDDAGDLTVVIEQEIIAALEEMILAFQKEMEKIREQQSQQPGQQGTPGEPGLVDKIAELKMLKTLQLRINRRTKTLGQMIEGEQATKPDVVEQLRELATRQGRLQRATYDLAVGKTAN